MNRLSLDVFQAILDAVSEKDSMRNLCLVSKDFKDVVRPLLFKEIDISLPRVEPPLSEWEAPPSWPLPPTGRSWPSLPQDSDTEKTAIDPYARLNSVLVACPQLAKSVQFLRMELSTNHTPASLNLLSIFHAQREHILSIHLCCSFMPSYRYLPETVRSGVESLFLDRAAPFSAILEGVNSFPSRCLSFVDHLDLRSTFEFDAANPPSSPYQHLKTLRTDARWNTAFATTALHGLQNLTHLTILANSAKGESPCSELANFLRAAPKISKITVLLGCPGQRQLQELPNYFITFNETARRSPFELSLEWQFLSPENDIPWPDIKAVLSSMRNARGLRAMVIGMPDLPVPTLYAVLALAYENIVQGTDTLFFCLEQNRRAFGIDYHWYCREPGTRPPVLQTHENCIWLEDSYFQECLPYLADA